MSIRVPSSLLVLLASRIGTFGGRECHRGIVAGAPVRVSWPLQLIEWKEITFMGNESHSRKAMDPKATGKLQEE